MPWRTFYKYNLTSSMAFKVCSEFTRFAWNRSRRVSAAPRGDLCEPAPLRFDLLRFLFHLCEVWRDGGGAWRSGGLRLSSEDFARQIKRKLQGFVTSLWRKQNEDSTKKETCCNSIKLEMVDPLTPEMSPATSSNTGSTINMTQLILTGRKATFYIWYEFAGMCVRV